MAHYLPYLVLVALWIYALVDCLGTPEREVRGLPKLIWVLIILFFGEILIGPLAWLMIGKRRPGMAYPQSAYGQPRRVRPESARGPGGAAESGAGTATAIEGEVPEPQREFIAPDDNPEFLRSLSELIKQQRKDGTSPSEGD